MGESVLEHILPFTSASDSAKVEIYCDERELRNNDIADDLKKLGAIVHVKMLVIGDFIVSDRCAVERKTRDDFEASIIDGRLFTQAKHLTANFSRVVVIIEGVATETRIQRAALLGAYSALMTDFGISIIFTRSTDATAEIVYAIAKHEQLAEKRPLRLEMKRKAHSLGEQQRIVLESLPLIGPSLAKALLNKFGSVTAVFTASEKELQEVEKMGKKKAALLRRVGTEKYVEEPDGCE